MPGVVIFDLRGAQMAERRVEPPMIVNCPSLGARFGNVMVWTPPTQRHRGAIAWSS
jgi:hypothetical protein